MRDFILLWVWQFPQQLLGKALAKAMGAKKRLHRDGVGFIEWRWFDRNRNRLTRLVSGVSLASTILLPYEDGAAIKHEFGHSAQSLMLGWLYLPIVGIYSAVFCNLWDRWFHKGWCRYDRSYWYYKKRWTERWADRLGGVDRDAELRLAHRDEAARYPAV